jgi:hypothetical protein
MRMLSLDFCMYGQIRQLITSEAICHQSSAHETRYMDLNGPCNSFFWPSGALLQIHTLGASSASSQDNQGSQGAESGCT